MNMDTLRIRSYNVLFGDALLISVPDRSAAGETIQRHILIDVGNVLSGKGGGGKDHVFELVLQDILTVLDGQPLDLYVMTHEHMDHVQGLFYAANKFGLELPVRYSWLTASSAPQYYEEHPQAKEKKLALVEAYKAISDYTLALNAAGDEVPEAVEVLLMNNNVLSAADDDPDAPPQNPLSTRDCINYLRSLATEKTSYIHRTSDLQGTHPFQEARLEIWGPEEDTSLYYGRFRPLALSVAPAPRSNARPKLQHLIPPPGVDTSAFYHLVEARRSGFVENLLAIDQSANNSSIVFALEWRGWRLLFPGDAEVRSWQEMNKRELLKPVHFLKVSHHGSHNGTPASALLDKILPLNPVDGQERVALVSSHPGTYNAVPDDDTLARLQQRGLILRSVGDESEGGGFVDVEFVG